MITHIAGISEYLLIDKLFKTKLVFNVEKCQIINNTISCKYSLQRFQGLVNTILANGFDIIEKNDKLPYVVLSKKTKKVNHKLNLLLCFVSFGLWVLPWFRLCRNASRPLTILIGIDDEGVFFENTCYNSGLLS
jgi:hypothetical protein